MKKRRLNGLSLKKKTISSLDNVTILGGETAIGDGGTCGYGSNACPTNRPLLCGTRPSGNHDTTPREKTLELSFCYGTDIPNPCMSIGACA